MKHRTYLATLVLFLFSFNLGIFIISVTTLKDTINRTKEQSLGEHYFITSALLKDFKAVESRGIDIESSLDSLLQPYGYLSGDKKVGLALYKGNQLVYSNRLGTELQNNSWQPTQDGTRLVSLQKSAGSTNVIVSGKLPAPYDLYTIIYLYDMTDAITSWQHMKNTLFLAGLVLSSLLALGLLLLLNRIFKPLAQISETSRDIAAGAYETRLPVSGHDELAEMAQSFNHMAEEIQSQMVELISAAEKKQQFIDNFAHELRTPLTAIYGYAEYMQKAVLTEDDRLSAVNYIMSESRRMQTMAYQLLELANLKNDQTNLESLNVSGLFQSVQQTLQQKMEEKEIQIEYVCETDVVWGDACLLESLLVNLIDNAIKACSRGGHVIVRAALEAGKKTIFIEDDGKGMSSEVLRHITEPFYRAEKSRNHKDGGAGLGLAICRQIVFHHDAELEFISHPGEGTTAKITFTTSK
ncbi:MAG TPA: HAMP domain-containing sensor histidine kinase [Syntrophomonadaceae bacterium]|nr:HAMP domain-containing sensor histidine kinase [Syntrophomonadaceae bacterium]